MSERKIRVLVAKPGLAMATIGGRQVVASVARCSGFRLFTRAFAEYWEMIAEAALQEDVDVARLSILSVCTWPSARVWLSCCAREVWTMRRCCGIVPDQDIEPLRQAGTPRPSLAPEPALNTLWHSLSKALQRGSLPDS